MVGRALDVAMLLCDDLTQELCGYLLWVRGGRGKSTMKKFHVTNFLNYSQSNRSLGMADWVLDVDVFLCDDFYMSSGSPSRED